MMLLPIAQLQVTLASDFSGVFDLFRYVMLAPFFGIGAAIGLFIGGRVSASRGRVIGPLVLIGCVIVTALFVTWTGNEFINLF